VLQNLSGKDQSNEKKGYLPFGWTKS